MKNAVPTQEDGLKEIKYDARIVLDKNLDVNTIKAMLRKKLQES